jgi:hypothetical protein
MGSVVWTGGGALGCCEKLGLVLRMVMWRLRCFGEWSVWPFRIVPCWNMISNGIELTAGWRGLAGDVRI